jgi:hypothetical protein
VNRTPYDGASPGVLPMVGRSGALIDFVSRRPKCHVQFGCGVRILYIRLIRDILRRFALLA